MTSNADAPPPPQPPSELEAERTHLLRSVAKLEESIVAIKAALADGDPDRSLLRDALSEDLVLIAKQRARAAAIEDELRRLGGAAAAGLTVATEPRWLTGERRAREEGGGGAAAPATTSAAAADAAAADAAPGVWL